MAAAQAGAQPPGSRRRAQIATPDNGGPAGTVFHDSRHLRFPQRHRYPAHAGNAPGHGRGGGRRRRVRRRSHRRPAGGNGGHHAGQRCGPVRSLGHHVELDCRAAPLPAKRRVDLRGGLPHLQLRARGLPPQIAGLASRAVEGCRGVLQAEQLENLVRPDDHHNVRTRLVCLENTHNRGGGTIQPYPVVEAITGWPAARGSACISTGPG